MAALWALYMSIDQAYAAAKNNRAVYAEGDSEVPANRFVPTCFFAQAGIRLPVRLASLAVYLAAVLLAGCAVQPTTGTRLTANTALAEDRSVLLVVDVCVNFSPLAGSDYFVVEPAQQGADAMVKAVHEYLAVHGVKVGTALTPFICGALHDAQNQPKRVATSIDKDVTARPQPLWVAPPVAADDAYRTALHELATWSYQGALARATEGQSGNPPPRWVDESRAQQAMRVVRERSGHSSLIYVGVTGNSHSAEKASAVNVLRFVSGVALSMAIGPIYVGQSGMNVVFVPGGLSDSMQMAAALVDLRDSRVASTRIVHSNGDPIKAEALVHPDALGLLLREITLIPASRGR